MNQPLDHVPMWMLCLGSIALTLLAMEVGYRLGRWRHDHAAGEKEAPVGAMVGSILGLLAFLLAFTFSAAAGRFEARRQAVLEEANAVGTTYLRAKLLPEPFRSEITRELREYVSVRVEGVRDGKVLEAIARSEELHDALWTQTVKWTEKSQPTILTSVFVQSLNQMIDLHAKRVYVGTRNRIPIVIWVGLFALALLGMMAVGYQAGLSATKRSPAMLGMTLAFSGVLLMIVDLDRGFEGFLQVSQQAMIDVQRSMNAPGN